MPSNDREIFAYFRSDPNTKVEIDHLAYASYAYDKYEWMERFEELNQRPPTLEEENSWISQLPSGRLDEIREDAFRSFESAARSYMSEQIEQDKKQAVDHSILAEIKASNTLLIEEIKRFTSFWPNFGRNLFIGFSASLLFSVLVIIMGTIFAHDPSPIALYKHFSAPTPSNASQP